MSRLFTSESVTEGHPDKIADSIFRRHPRRPARGGPGARLAAETSSRPARGRRGRGHHRGLRDVASIARRRSSTSASDFREAAGRRVLRRHHARQPVAGHRAGVDDVDSTASTRRDRRQPAGAGDQGLMFGRGDDPSAQMPLPIDPAHRLLGAAERGAQGRHARLPAPRDGKTVFTGPLQRRLPSRRRDGVPFHAARRGGATAAQLTADLTASRRAVPRRLRSRAPGAGVAQPHRPRQDRRPHGDAGGDRFKIIVDVPTVVWRPPRRARPQGPVEGDRSSRTRCVVPKNVVASGSCRAARCRPLAAIGAPRNPGGRLQVLVIRSEECINLTRT